MSNTSFELRERYPLAREVGTVPVHDVSKGLRRHMPLGYDQLGRYREARPFPWLLSVVIVVGFAMMARAVL